MDNKPAGPGGALATGVALAVTAGAGYIACALAFRAWPQAAMDFMNALFHGLDFGRLARGPALFDFGAFFFALLVTVAWAFALGTLFGWVAGRLRAGARP